MNPRVNIATGSMSSRCGRITRAPVEPAGDPASDSVCVVHPVFIVTRVPRLWIPEGTMTPGNVVRDAEFIDSNEHVW